MVVARSRNTRKARNESPIVDPDHYRCVDRNLFWPIAGHLVRDWRGNFVIGIIASCGAVRNAKAGYTRPVFALKMGIVSSFELQRVTGLYMRSFYKKHRKL